MENKNGIKSVGRRLTRSPATGSIVFLIALFLFLGVTTKSFLKPGNMPVLTQAAMVTIMVGMAQMASLAVGGMNLAIGAMGGAAAIFCASMMEDFGMATGPAILIGLGVGASAGIINGIIISALGASQIITWLITMAMSNVYTGIMKAWNHGMPFQALNADFCAFGAKTLGGHLVLVYVALFVCLLVSLLYKFTGIGRQMLALGSNRNAAALNGIHIKRTVIFAHGLSGFLAAVAGILLSMRMATTTVDIGEQWGYYSFAAPFIGGVGSGRVSVLGTIFGGIVLATIENGIIHLGISAYWTTLVRGVVILLAVSFNTYRERMLAHRR